MVVGVTLPVMVLTVFAGVWLLLNTVAYLMTRNLFKEEPE